jgi:N-acetylated-alpha-linked acidic dipeptidase
VSSKLRRTDSIGVSPLGSGSDYTVFLQHLGVSPSFERHACIQCLNKTQVASTHGGFKSTLSDPVYHYHSIFDSPRWQELYGDPGFVRHVSDPLLSITAHFLIPSYAPKVAIAKHIGLQTLRLASSIIIPLNTTHYSLELQAYLQK